MEQEKKLKNVKEVFKDYNSNSFELNEALIENINLYKKKSELELILRISKNIKIEDLFKFEKYIEERFQVKSANIKLVKDKIEDEENTDEIISKHWLEIVAYVAKRHPMARALLKGSNVNVHNNIIQINLAGTGKNFLEANNFNKIISDVIINFYQKKYRI